jgi:predicted O-methyltransferase YrrM
MIKIAFRYLFYKLFAKHRKGFGVHSPFVFHLVSKVLTKKDDENLKQILSFRRNFLRDKSILQTNDAGAGSKTHRRKERSIRQILNRSSIRHKYGRILYALANELNPATIIELGTGIGISTAYLAKGCPGSRTISIEADKQKMTFATNSFEQMGLRNVTAVNGTFGELLPGFMKIAVHPVLVFVDGDHSFEGTKSYFEEIMKYADSETVIIFDDIRWSEGMEKAWDAIKADSRVVLSIDLFFMGIVFFRKGMTKQDFVVNY